MTTQTSGTVCLFQPDTLTQLSQTAALWIFTPVLHAKPFFGLDNDLAVYNSTRTLLKRFHAVGLVCGGKRERKTETQQLPGR